MYPHMLRVHLKKDQRRTLSNGANAMFLWVCFSEFLYKSICSGYSFELHPRCNCFYKDVDKKSTLAVI